ncbi:MAG: VWA domain-containing protein [Myxococcales bacterium FL481]|nr:MAG: VWA domain-containing protein [Myxococcales bacterium FL481]
MSAGGASLLVGALGFTLHYTETPPGDVASRSPQAAAAIDSPEGTLPPNLESEPAPSVSTGSGANDARSGLSAPAGEAVEESRASGLPPSQAIERSADRTARQVSPASNKEKKRKRVPASARLGHGRGGIPGGVPGGVFGGVPGGGSTKLSGLSASRHPRTPTWINSGKPQPGGQRHRGHERPHSRERDDHQTENEMTLVAEDPKSTFSIDVDTASYSNIRRFIREGTLPPSEAVRLEEMVNYFDYDYPQPEGDAPFAVAVEVGPAPWDRRRQLVRIGLQGKQIPSAELPTRNLVFLLDVSGSMQGPDRLPLVKRALTELARTLTETDRVSIVVYAGASGTVLEPTPGSDVAAITRALDRLEAGGSTDGGAGIQRAYELAERAFVRGGVNRVILATDGDFNVGTTSRRALVEVIEDKRRGGVSLSVLGFGRGNLNDAMMEQLADHGNGNYAYIDNIAEARKVLVREGGGTLVTIAKDVKIQVEFAAESVESFRLVGYENRVLAHADFDDDRKDAGEIGVGHSVTALYEIVPRAESTATDLMDLRLRYKRPQGDLSRLQEVKVSRAAAVQRLADTTADFRFAAAVAQAGLALRHSRTQPDATLANAYHTAACALGPDRHGERQAFLDLVRKAAELRGERWGRERSCTEPVVAAHPSHASDRVTAVSRVEPPTVAGAGARAIPLQLYLYAFHLLAGISLLGLAWRRR